MAVALPGRGARQSIRVGVGHASDVGIGGVWSIGMMLDDAGLLGRGHYRHRARDAVAGDSRARRRSALEILRHRRIAMTVPPITEQPGPAPATPRLAPRAWPRRPGPRRQGPGLTVDGVEVPADA